ncbi:MAG: hypothetical protein M3O22_07370 [Pseudomonadota bacterium]|nr:hypothetical protein [Pseudomonadota bacterium]
MSIAGRLVEHVVADMVLQGRPALSGTSRAGRAVAVVILFFGSLGLVLLLYAAWLALSARFPVDMAVAITGLLSIGTALLVALSAWAVCLYRRKRIMKAPRDAGKAIQSALSLLEGDLAEPVRKHPGTAVAIAALTGFILGKRLF